MLTQLFADGITVIVAVIGALVVFVAVNDGISPVPLAASPIEMLSFVQLKLLPLTLPVKFTVLVVALLHKTCFVCCTTYDVELPLVVKFFAAPGHSYVVGITVMVAVTGALVVLMAVNAGILPVPPAAKPIDVLLFVQLKTVLLTLPLKFTALVADPLHKFWLTG